jgi:hypothetical protein
MNEAGGESLKCEKALSRAKLEKWFVRVWPLGRMKPTQCIVAVFLLILMNKGMDMLLKKDVGQSANHATSNTPWVSG